MAWPESFLTQQPIQTYLVLHYQPMIEFFLVTECHSRVPDEHLHNDPH